MELPLKKEVPILIEGPQPVGYHLLKLVAQSQEIARRHHGLGAMAVYKLPNRFNDEK